MDFDFNKVLTAAGGAALSTMGPLGTVAAAALNEFLDDDKKVDVDTPMSTVKERIEQLSPEERESLFSKKLDLAITDSNNWTVIQRMMNADNGKASSRRPFVAELMAWCVVGIIATVCLTWLASAWKTGEVPPWDSILATMALPSALLRSYFGLKSKEYRDSLSVGCGGRPEPAIGSELAKRVLAINKG